MTGTGECGKSTFIKQMRIILGGGFAENQYEYYLRVVHKNLHQAGASLSSAMKTLSIPYQNQVQLYLTDIMFSRHYIFSR